MATLDFGSSQDPTIPKFEYKFERNIVWKLQLDDFTFPDGFNTNDLSSLDFKMETVFDNDNFLVKEGHVKMFEGMPDGNLLVRTTMKYPGGCRGKNQCWRQEWNLAKSIGEIRV